MCVSSQQICLGMNPCGLKNGYLPGRLRDYEAYFQNVLGHQQYQGTLPQVKWGFGIHGKIWGFPKMVVPNNHGVSYKNDHFGVFWGYHHFKKHPYSL